MKQKLLKKMGLIILVVSLFTSFAVMITNMLLDTCSIKYVTYGGNMFIEEVVRGTKITLDNSISRDGYDFVGWTMGDDSNIVSEIVVKNDTILVANWKVVEHSIYYNGISYVVYNNAVITYRDNTVSFTTVDGNMVTLCGAKDYDWKLSEGSLTTPITNSFSLNYSKSSAIELSQEYRGKTYSVSIMESEGYTLNAETIDVNSGENAIFEVVLQEGYTNSNIYIEGIEYSAINTRKGVYVVTLYGVSEDMHIDILGVQKNTYKVLLDYDGGEYVKGLGEYELQHGDKLYLPIPKKAGYNFLYWIDTRTNLIIDKEDVLVRDNMTLKAIYRLATYTVKLPTSTSGSYVTTYLNNVITDTNNVYEITKLDTITFTVSVSEMYDSASVQLYYMLDTLRVDIPVVANGLNI
ncbi:MAG: InlB B-repeat-containing protein, partial [Clostridia bacterium]|nr:InlB B-repeat-containing protein [Clostridia bacterium]